MILSIVTGCNSESSTRRLTVVQPTNAEENVQSFTNFNHQPNRTPEQAVQTEAASTNQENIVACDRQQLVQQQNVQHEEENDVTTMLDNIKKTSLDHYQIDWKRIDSDALDHLNKRIDNATFKKKVINTVIGEMRFINNYKSIRIRHLQSAARQIVEKYPELSDTLRDGTLSGTGYSCILNKLRWKNGNYMRGSQRGDLNQTLNIRPKNLRLIDIIKIGCSSWQPELPGNETMESLVEKQKQLKNYKQLLQTNVPLIYQLSRETFCIQRHFLNQLSPPPTIKDVKTEWPVILEASILFQHFRILTGKNFDTILQEFNNTVSSILSFGENKQGLRINRNSTNREKLIAFVDILSQQFNEDSKNVITLVEVRLT